MLGIVPYQPSSTRVLVAAHLPPMRGSNSATQPSGALASKIDAKRLARARRGTGFCVTNPSCRAQFGLADRTKACLPASRSDSACSRLPRRMESIAGLSSGHSLCNLLQGGQPMRHQSATQRQPWDRPSHSGGSEIGGQLPPPGLLEAHLQREAGDGA